MNVTEAKFKSQAEWNRSFSTSGMRLIMVIELSGVQFGLKSYA